MDHVHLQMECVALHVTHALPLVSVGRPVLDVFVESVRKSMPGSYDSLPVISGGGDGDIEQGLLD